MSKRPKAGRRYVLTSVGAGLLALSGCLGDDDEGADGETVDNGEDDSDESDSDDTEAEGAGTEELEVENSIQQAIDEVDDGGIVTVPEGIYEESITIDKPLTLEAANDVTLDGVDDESVAISVEADDVTIDGFEIVRYLDGGIVTNSRPTELAISNIKLENVDGKAIDITINEVTINDVHADEIGDAAIVVDAASDGFVSISEVDVSHSGGGIMVDNGDSVNISGIETLMTEGDGIVVRGEDVRDQSVTIDNCLLVEQSGGKGIYLSGTSGEDEVTITDTELIDNDDAGIDVTCDIVEIDGVTATGNGVSKAGIVVTSSSDGEVEVTDTIVEDTARGDGGFTGLDEDERGRGLHIAGGETVTVEDVTLEQNGGYLLRIEADDVRGQDVNIVNCSLTENDSGAAISIPGTSGTDSVTISGTDITDSDSESIDVTADIVKIDDVTAINSGVSQAGILVESSSDGEVELTDTTVEDTNRGDGGFLGLDEDERGRGIHVINGETVTVENINLADNGGHQLKISADDTRDQSVSIDGGTVERNESGDGIHLPGSDGSDEHTIQDIGIFDNNGVAIESGGTDVVIESVSTDGNEDGNLTLTEIDESEATISNSF